ncbi:MAG: hypothetical protein SNG20_05430 [Rikenellaceae bacterium]
MKIRNILLLSLLLLVGACSDYDYDEYEDQCEDIETFLTTYHSPTLIAESDVAESLEYQPEFYSYTGNRVYRYISDYYNTDRDAQREVVDGDTLLLTFWVYDFSTTTSAPSSSTLLYTNDPLYEDAYIEAGLNVEYWDFSPKEIVLGSGDILKSIETALVGCREGDSVEFYLTFNVAYGDSWIGLSSLEEPIAFFCTIDSIEN